MSLTKSMPFFFIFCFIISLLVHLSHADNMASQEDTSNKHLFNIGAIIDVNSRTGREQKIAMESAIQHFNNMSKTSDALVLYVRDSSGDSIKAASMAKDLTEGHKAQIIIGMQTWQEAAKVAEVGNQAQVPVVSFSSTSTTPQLISLQWPFLVRMVNNNSMQMRCLASIVGSYGWRKVVAVYEDDAYGSSLSSITLLSEALQEVDSEVEHRLVLPPFSSLANPRSAIQKELEKLKIKQSRVFLILQSSPAVATHLFIEAKKLGMMGKDSVWLTTEPITNMLDTFNSGVISSMQGLIGIKSYYSETSSSYVDLSKKFRTNLRLEYPEEDNLKPGIYALRAYDAISSVVQAREKLKSSNSTSKLLQGILSSKFVGLSGEIRFEKGGLASSPVYRIVNVIGKSYQELGFWSSEMGFSLKDNREGDHGRTMQVLGDLVHWPGNLMNRVPKGLVMPNGVNPLKIGILARKYSENFVKMREDGNATGFSIEVFEEVVKILTKKFDLPYMFEPFIGSYDELVNQVYLKKFDAVVGDVTILANRSKYVEFTQPYLESGLSMIVPMKPDHSRSAWMFLEPFTITMWVVVSGIYVYTMFMLWLLEHKTNSEFGGTWRAQLGSTFWYTFSSLFFAHKEQIRHNLTRIVVMVWFLVVFVVTSSYTASLTSMLTVQRMEPTVSNINVLKRDNLVVGCDGASFVKRYLVEVLNFRPDNVKSITSEDSYEEAFRSEKISAAFLELPYQRLFTAKHCNEYKVTGPIYRFGGFGFVFQKGSPLVAEVSEAFLALSEDGTLEELEKKWFESSPECVNPEVSNKRLDARSFWPLFVLSFVTTTLAWLIHYVRIHSKSRLDYHHADTSRLVQLQAINENPTTAETDCINEDGISSSNGNYSMESPSPNIIRTANRNRSFGRRNTHRTEFLSFPGWNGRDRGNEMFSSARL